MFMSSRGDANPLNGLNVNDLAELAKSLTAGNAINNPGSAPGEGFALRMESLENTEIITTFRAEHIKLWKAIPKQKAYNTVEEHNVVTSYGDNASGFFAEGGRPTESDSTIDREYAKVKLLGVERSVSHVAAVVKSAHGPTVPQQTKLGTMDLLQKIERSLFNGDSALDELQYDGVTALIERLSPAENVIDMRGKPLDIDAINQACARLSDGPNYARPTDIHFGNRTYGDIVEGLYPQGRHASVNAPVNGTVGLRVDAFASDSGTIRFNSNTFINDGGSPHATFAGKAGERPSSPSISTGQAVAADAASRFTAAHAGEYFYSVAAHNDKGYSAAVDVSGTAISVAAGQKVTFGITPVGDPTVKWYQVWRTPKNGTIGSKRLIARIPNTEGVGELVFEDLNTKIAGTSNAYLWEQNAEVLAFKQLTPLMKMPLATIDTRIRWLQIMYGVPVLKAPGKALMFTNIGRRAGSVT